MRRKDREMDKQFALNIIDHSQYGVLSVVDGNGEPYGIPLSMVRVDELIYFHSATKGRKIDALNAKPTVSITFVGKTNVPELFTDSELEEMMKDGNKANTLISKVFTTEFESAIVTGQVALVDNQQEAISAMKHICEKYTPSKMSLFDMAIKSSMKKTNVYKVTIHKVTAKRKKFDSQGEEIKRGRLE